MKALIKAVDAVALFLYTISGVLLVAMMLCVVADVGARSLFAISNGAIDLTFVGGIELVKYGLLFCMVFAFPYAVDKGQIIVDLFTQNMGERMQRGVDGLYIICFGLFGALLSWRFFEAGLAARANGELTQDLLLPMGPVYMVASGALAVLAVRGLLCGITDLIFGRKPGEEKIELGAEEKIA